MRRFDCNLAKSTSTTEVDVIFPPRPNFQITIAQLTTTPAAAGDTMAFYLTRPEFATIATRDATPTQSATHIYIDVDVAAGHVVKGHTLTTNDYLIGCANGAWWIRKPSAVTDVAAETYCDVTVSSIGAAAKAGDKVWVCRAADRTTYSTGGTAQVRIDNDFLNVDVNVPFAMGSYSAGTNDATMIVTVRYDLC